MKTHFCAAIVLAFVAGVPAAQAQTLIENGTVVGRPLQLTPAERTIIYRTIIPQSRGRAPIVRERIVREPIVPVPVVRERVFGQPVETYAYDPYGAYAYAPPYRDYTVSVGSLVPAGARLVPIPPAVVAEVPAVRSYRYMVVNDRMLLVDPVTGIVAADLTD
jgi:hypothetical protein